MPRTKIVCTIGPSSRSPETLARLAEAGMDVARLNFSHGTHGEHAAVIAAVRAIAERLGRPIAILQDLAGVKIRIGEIAGGAVRLEPGAAFTLTTRSVAGDAREVTLDFPELGECVRPGDALLLRTERWSCASRRCPAATSAAASSSEDSSPRTRGSTSRTAPSPRRASRQGPRGPRVGIERGVDYVALSFVRSASDVLTARRFLDDAAPRSP